MPEVGIVIPAHACALGKAILAFDDDFADDVFAGDLRSMTGDTLTSVDALQAQLAEVRATGVATEVEEAVLGECEVAAPVSDRLGHAVGAIGLVVTSGDWPLDQAVVDSVRAAARTVSRELGSARWPPLAGSRRPGAARRGRRSRSA
jgi:DNA-binding IclR family transcriptional regulator